jgi:iron complex outermembrane receptor protein
MMLMSGAAATALLAFAPCPANAQDEKDDAARGARDEIVVTARRTEESLQDVPGAVSAFSADSLQQIGASDPTGLQGAVPNLNIVQSRGSSNATNIYLRGVGQPDVLQTFDPAVGFYVDDVYYSRIRGTQLELFDIDRVEVLRGPQGTLYGKNTIGGALKLVTRRPDQDARAFAQATLGNYGQTEVRVGASGPLSDTLAVGGALLRAKRDGYVVNPTNAEEYNDRDAWAGRAQMVWDPTSQLNIYITADYAEEDNAMVLGQPTNSLFNFLGQPIYVSPTPLPKYDFTGQRSEWLDNQTAMTHWGVSGTAALELSDEFSLKSITAYRDLHTIDNYDVDATPLEIFDAFLDVEQNQFSQELQGIYESDRLTVVGGVYYLREHITSFQMAEADDLVRGFFLPAFPPFIPPNAPATFFVRTIDEDLVTSGWAAYANASFKLTDRLSISGGVRYTEEKKDYFRDTDAFSDNILLTAPNTLDDEDKWSDVSPSATLDYRINDNVMVYARYAEGYKSGGFNGRANSAAENFPYEPEEMKSYEAGVKSDWPEQRLRLNLTGFYNDYKNFQARVQDTTTTIPPQILLTVLNAGKLEIYGVEFEMTYAPVEALVIDAQVGYQHTEYDEFDDERFTNFGGSRAFQTPAFSPKWTARAGASYRFDLDSLGELRLNGSAKFRSRMALAVDNTIINTDIELPGMFSDDYWLYDASLVWTAENGMLSVGAFGRNLADKLYRTDAQEFSNLGNTRTVYYGAPRTYGVVLTVRL